MFSLRMGGVNDLRISDLRAAHEFAAELSACVDRDQLEAQVLQLVQLIGADTIVLGEVQAAGSGLRPPVRLIPRIDPPGSFDREALEAFERWAYQHPQVRGQLAGLLTGSARVSDLLATAAWRRTSIYDGCYRRSGVHWEIATHLRLGNGDIACAALQRAHRDFAERELAMLDLIAPHLRAAYARVELRAEAARRRRLLERDLEQRGELSLLARAGGHVLEAGPRARAVLRAWFDTDRSAAALPDQVVAWHRSVRGSAAPPPLVRVGRGRRLVLRLVEGDDGDLIVLGEHRDRPPSAERLAASLPLTRREAEVLALVASGLTNEEIARRLQISAHTVARHLERVYPKLDVHNRAAATALALGALGDGSDGPIPGIED
jgi:DNA-binding CsgD family transcriptional regulator